MGRWASPLEWYLLEEPVPACLSRPNSNLWSFGLRLKAGIKGMGSRLLYLLGMGSRKRAHDEWDPRQWHMRCGWWSCLLLVFSTQTQNQLRPWKQVANSNEEWHMQLTGHHIQKWMAWCFWWPIPFIIAAQSNKPQERHCSLPACKQKRNVPHGWLVDKPFSSY